MYTGSALCRQICPQDAPVVDLLQTVEQTTIEPICLVDLSIAASRAVNRHTALSTIAQNSRRIAMMDGDSGTLEGSHVPDGILTSILFDVEGV